MREKVPGLSKFPIRVWFRSRFPLVIGVCPASFRGFRKVFRVDCGVLKLKENGIVGKMTRKAKENERRMKTAYRKIRPMRYDFFSALEIGKKGSRKDILR